MSAMSVWPPSLTPGQEIALRLDTNVYLAKSITAAQRTAMYEAKKKGSVDAYMQRRRMCERLAIMGLLSKTGLTRYTLTVRGAAVLSIRV